MNKSKKIKVKSDKNKNELFFDLKDFVGMVDTTKVVSYEMIVNPDKSVTLKFYDKNDKLLPPLK